MRKFLIITFSLLYISTPVLALDFDVSVDEEIKKKYNTSKLQYDVLPNLPKVNNTTQVKPTTQTSSVPKTSPTNTTTLPTITKVDSKDAIKIPKWTKFQVKSNQTISDWSKEGAIVSFTTVSPVTKRYLTIPTGAKIQGIITDAHRPQIAGNGGLVVIKMTNITFNGKSYYLNGKVTKANGKKIFFNNIKGKHSYWSGVDKQISKGEKFYQKSRATSTKMSNNPILVLLSPIPTVVGFVGCCAWTVISPITGIGAKGGNLSIPSGAQFELKLLEDTFVSAN